MCGVVWRLLCIGGTCGFDRLSACCSFEKNRGEGLGEGWRGFCCVRDDRSTRSLSGFLTVSSCHGPAIFPGVNDADGKPIIAGKKITGFTTQAEYDMKVMDTLREWKEPLVDEHAKALGAECKLIFRDHEYEADPCGRRAG